MKLNRKLYKITQENDNQVTYENDKKLHKKMAQNATRA